MKRYAPVLCILALIATKLWWSWYRDKVAEANPVPRIHPIQPMPRPATDTPATDKSDTPAAGLAPAPSTPALRRLADAAARVRVMRAIDAARARRTGAPAAAAPAPAATADGEPPMSAADVRAGFKAVVPLLADCYERALPRLAVKSGSINVHMHATGEPDVGTLIDDATIDGGGGLLDDQELGECLHETLMSVELPPMPEGGVVEITYPITFQESGD
jgi:hypothetical protein